MTVTQLIAENPDILYKHLKWFALHFHLPLKSPAKFTLFAVSSRGVCKK